MQTAGSEIEGDDEVRPSSSRVCSLMSKSDPLLPGSDPPPAPSARFAPAYRFPVLAGILKAVESVLDWLPLIAVSSLSGSYPPSVALASGTAAGALVLLLQFLKKRFYHPGAVFPKTMDLGQFGLFGILWVLSVLLQSNQLAGKLLVLWFNPVTTGGVGLIMWISIIQGRPFVLDYVQGEMPDFV